MLRARLREDEVAAHLGVDPKTIQRWLKGRVPYASNRTALADLLGADEVDLWPDVRGSLVGRARPEELGAIYPHRWTVPRDVWVHFFNSAAHEIDVLAYSALFLAEDGGLLRLIEEKALNGVQVRFVLGNPDSPFVALRGKEEGIGDAMAAKIRNALMLYRPLMKSENVEIRLHNTVLYNSIYHADSQLIVNQHAYGIPAAHSPVYCFRIFAGADMASGYLSSFETVWDSATQP
jgi:hypothetical protein